MSYKEAGILGQIIGGVIAAAAIFLPGTFLIFFVYKIWDRLKKYRVVKASLEGIVAVSAGMVLATALTLFNSLEVNILNSIIVWLTVAILFTKKVPVPYLIISSLVAGILL